MDKDITYYMGLKYEIRIYPIPDSKGGGYEAFIPLLGRYSFFGDGDTIKEALADLHRTKKENFEVLLKEGADIPEPQEKKEEHRGRILVRVPRYLHKALADQAAENGISLNNHISTVLAAGFPVAELKKAIKDMCDLWSSMVYRYEIIQEPPARQRDLQTFHQAA